MVATDLNLSQDTRVGEQRVYVKRRWSDEWELAKGLEWDSARWATLPGIGSATLTRSFGLGQFPGDATATYQSKLNLDGWFVWALYIPLGGQLLLDWYGIILTEERQFFDNVTDPATGDTRPSGQQVFHAVELAHLLGKKPILKSFAAKGSDTIEIGVTPDFNARGVANQALASEGLGTVFAEVNDEDHAEFWSSRTLLEYVFERHPLEKGDETGVGIPLSIDNPEYLPDWDRPQVRQEGASLLDITGSVLSMRRGLGGYLDVEIQLDGSPDKLVLKVFTFTETELNLGGEEGETLHANYDSFNLLIDKRPDFGVSLKTTSAEAVTRVVVQGGHRRAVCTLDPQEDVEEYIRDWTDDDLDKYNAGGSTAADYSSLTPVEKKKERNARVRHSPTLRHVFQRFKVNPEWNGKVASGLTPAPQDRRPVFVDDEDPDKVYGNWPAGWNLLPALPLYEGVDYSDDKIDDKEIPQQISEETPFMPCMIFFPKKGDTDQFFEATAGNIGKKDSSDDLTWSTRMRCEDDKPRIHLDVVGAEAHKIGDGAFVPLSGVDDTEILYDWKTALVTVCFEESRRVQVKWPEEIPSPENVAVITERLFDVGNGFRLDNVIFKTAIGVKDDGTLIRSNGGFSRDDRPKMKVMAQQLYDFYSRPRQVLHCEKVGITKELWLGHFIKQLGSEDGPSSLIEPIGTVVTGVSVDFPRGTVGSPPGPPSQVWNTSQGELDALIVPPKRGRR